MNAMLEPTDPTRALSDAITERALKKARREQKAAELARHERAKTSAEEQVRSQEQVFSKQNTARADYLRELIATAEGHIEVKPDPAHTAAAESLAAAKQHLSLVSDGLVSIEAEHAEADKAVKAAERAVEIAADVALDAERETLAVEINADAERLRRKVHQLQELVTVDINAPLNDRREIVTTPAVKKALECMPQRDSLHIPVNELQILGDGGFYADPRPLAARRAALIRGELIVNDLDTAS